MPESPNIQSVIKNPRLNRIIPIAIAIYMLISLGALIYILFQAKNWLLPSFSDRITYLYLPFFSGLIYFACGYWVFSSHRRDAAGINFILFTSSTALDLFLLYDAYHTKHLTYLWSFALACTGGSFLNLALQYPYELTVVNNFSSLRWVGFLPSLALFLGTIPGLSSLRPTADTKVWSLYYIFIGSSFLAFMAGIIYRHSYSSSPIIREQCRLTFWGSVVAFVPIGSWFLIAKVSPTVAFSPLLILPIILFPLVMAYNLLHYRALQANFFLRQSLLYGSLILVTAVGYALVVTGTTLFVTKTFQVVNPYLIGIIVLVLAFLFDPVRHRIQERINIIFSRGQAAYRERLQAFSRELTQVMDLNGIVSVLRRYINDSLMPFHLHIFIHEPLGDHYYATKDDSGQPTSDLFFPVQSPLVHLLKSRRSSLSLDELKTLPRELNAEKARLKLLGAQLFIPLPGQQRLMGWLALGPRRSGEVYNQRDLAFLETLADQSALAVERAQVILDLERRIHQMNILSRLSQGLNVTPNFDDILELINAQTTQIIPNRDFHITLLDSHTDLLYHVFYLENDERLREREHQSVPYSQGLEREIIQSSRSIVTDDYERECRSKGVLPVTKGLFSWIGVPLNTGAETIGAISLGSRDASVIYTMEQANLLQAIADQAAGAIVKSRLLEETERRAKQMATLNDVSRNLGSTLELVPLLNLILRSAVEILNCEAGSLMLVDKDIGDLTFKAVVGPASSNLVGQRLPAGTGLAGKAVTLREAIIANDAQLREDWSDRPDKNTGSSTQDLLVVPMIYQEDVSGVIEVINRRDGQPFTSDDEELLSAFASQAAVALENARLYTQTDQTLTERVEELSVMQRIDRELNASLDVNRAMRLTLDWAMRQSQAHAGLVGMVEEKGVRIMASQGYSVELSSYPESRLPFDFPTIQASIESVQPQSLQVGELQARNTHTILQGTREHLVVPIRRESQVIGLIILESKEPTSHIEDQLGFLSRLSDHAAIAIANAQLYAEVQAANQAKSDFVSLVSHELKTPMTSIRGFTDLLSAGVVGAVNENQANFLTTIRSNVDRMATLVSDLADVSRIEAGRMRLEFGPVPFSEVLEEVNRSTRSQIEEKRQTLTLSIPGEMPPIWGDRTRIIQVLTNLVSNAVKYTPQEGKIEVYAESVRNVWSEEPPQVIHVVVKDNGYGISLENQKRIFQKFFRSDDQKIRDAPGTGLGLNITKQLVEMQGGRIWFESVYRAGSTFHITLPIVETF